MIGVPKKAIKKFTKPSHREIVVGILLAYGLFPKTNDGVAKAKKFVEGLDEWIAPSDLPDYYDDIESDLMTGKTTPKILNIIDILEEFYGFQQPVKTVQAEVVVEEEPTSIVPANPVPVNSDPRVYDRVDKYIDDLKEETTANFNKAVDELEDNQKKFFEELEQKNREFFEKAKFKKNVVNVPLPDYLKGSSGFGKGLPPALYTKGMDGRYPLTFQNDLDHAVWYAGGTPKRPGGRSDKQKKVREWLYSLGLTYDDIVLHRKKIIQAIRKQIEVLSSLSGGLQSNDIYVPSVDQSFFLKSNVKEEAEEPEEITDEEIEEYESEEFDPDDVPLAWMDTGDTGDEDDEDEDIPDGLDDLLSDIGNEESVQVAKQVTDTVKELVDDEESLDDIFSDLPEDVRSDPEFLKVLNKTKKTSGNVTNRTILNTIKTTFGAIQGTLESVNQSINTQNALIVKSIDANAVVGSVIAAQTSTIESKFDQLFGVLNAQLEQAKQAERDRETALAEADLERQQQASGTADIDGGGGSGGGRSVWSILARKLGKKLFSKLWRFLPKGIRSRARLGRKILGRLSPKRLARKTAAKVAPRILSRVAPSLAERPASKIGQNLLQKALTSKAVQRALVNKIGKEAAEKLTVKIAAKLIPGVSTAYGLGEGLARIMMGDVKGGFLSFGSAIPIAGYGFAAIDLFREIDVKAYTRHIEPNLTNLKDVHIAAFLAEALGVTEGRDYERGGYAKGLTMLHGTEWVGTPGEWNNLQASAVSPVIGSILASSSELMGGVDQGYGARINSDIRRLSRKHEIPYVSVKSSIDGTLPNMGSSIVNMKNVLNTEVDKEALKKALEDRSKKEKWEEKVNRNRRTDRDQRELSGDYASFENEQDILDFFGASRVSSRFGARPAPLLADGRRGSTNHKGIDLPVPAGSDVPSVSDGTVSAIVADYGAPGGGAVYVKSLDGNYEFRYGHINPKAGLEVGDPVRRRDSVGKITDLGQDTHLHFETRMSVLDGEDYVAVDPIQELKDITTKVNQQSSDEALKKKAGEPSNFDVLIPLDHVPPSLSGKFPDKTGGNTFKQSKAAGAAGREREGQDIIAPMFRDALMSQGIPAKIVAPEMFSSYEEYDNYLKMVVRTKPGVRVIPLHLDAFAREGKWQDPNNTGTKEPVRGIGFGTIFKKGDRADEELANILTPILDKFSKQNPELGGDRAKKLDDANITLNTVADAQATLIELGSLVQIEDKYGKNFGSNEEFRKKYGELLNDLASAIKNKSGLLPNTQAKAQAVLKGDQYYTNKDNDAKTNRYIVISNNNPGSVGGFAGIGSIGFTDLGAYTNGRRRYISNAELNQRDLETLLSRLR